MARRLPEPALAALLLAPAALLVSVVVLVPIGRLLYLSLHELQLTRPNAGTPFVGLRNFADAWDDPRFWDALRNTLVVTVVTVPGAVLVGLGLALLADLPHRWRWPVRLGLLLPWALPLVFSGLIFAWFFDTRHGLVNDLLARLGLPEQPWLTRPGLAMAAVCAALVLKTNPFP